MLSLSVGSSRSGNLHNFPEHIVVVQYRHPGRFGEPFLTERHNPGISLENHRHRPIKILYLPDALGKIVVQVVALLGGIKLHQGNRKKFRKLRSNPDYPASGSSTAVGSGKGLVQIEEAEIKPRLLGPGNPHDAIEIRLIVATEPSHGVHQIGKLPDPGIVDPHILWVGDEQRCSTVVHRRLEGPRNPGAPPHRDRY